MVWSPEEEEILSRYRRMLKMGMPEGAVMQKMAVDGVDQHLQDAFTDEVVAGDDRGTDPPETALGSTENRLNPTLDQMKPDSVSSFFEEVIDDDDDHGVDDFVEEEIEEEVVFDDDDRHGDETQHQTPPPGYDTSGHPQSFNSQYTEESFYGSTEGDMYASGAATATTDMESQWQQSQIQQSQARQQHKSVNFPPPEQAPTPSTTTIEKPFPSPMPMWYWIACLALLILIGIAAGTGYWLTVDEDGAAPRVVPNVTEAPTLAPVRVSSQFNEVLGTCIFAGIAYPHPIDQCACSGSIRDIPADIRRRYEYNRGSFISTLYADFDDDISACAPRNQALVWVSSGDDESISEEERTQRYALSTVFASLSGAQWDRRDNWLAYGISSPCDWWGVNCSNTTSRIQSLSIPRNNVEGEVPGEISLLTSLRSIVASDNKISGPLPVAMFLLPRLEDVDVSVNAVTGVIPQTVSQATSLRTLSVARNSMSGRLTPEIGRMSSLEMLNLNSNNYEGSLPTELFQLSSLRDLNIGGNQFFGSISASISQMSALERLTLGPNSFSGILQTSIQELSNLKLLSIQGVEYTGRLPAAFGEKLTNLETLIITNTLLEGNIATSFGRLPKLKTLNLASNQFTSEIPSDFGNLQSLVSLRLDNNFMNGQIPVTLGNLAALEELWLNNNLLTGNVPVSLGTLSKLRTIRLESNRLRGRVVDNVCVLRGKDLSEFVVDCPLDIDNESLGIVCPIPDCCTRCEPLI